MVRSFDPQADRFHLREQKSKDHKSQQPGEDDDPLPPPVEQIKSDVKADRNDPCPCGSGKKYKKCCGKAGG